MKKIKTLIFVSISLLQLQCSTNDNMPIQGNVQFSIDMPAPESGNGRVVSIVLPSDAYVSISVERASGVSVYARKHIDLIKFGNDFVTAPLALAEGRYRLTEFMVLSKDNEVLFVVPKQSSTLAALVDVPLPIDFAIVKEGVLNLSIQVVNTTQRAPNDFGYASFGLKAVGSDFSISLFTADNRMSLASGVLNLYRGDSLIFTQALLPKINPVNFKGKPDEVYTLVVEKEGYTFRSKTYVLHTLVDELNGTPLEFILIPASTIKLLVIEPSDMEIQLATLGGEIAIDWGDDKIENITATNGSTTIRHTYGTPARYFINLTGDVSSITDYVFNFVDYNIVVSQDIEAVDISRMSELKDFSLDWRKGPGEINFSHNTKLEVINVGFTWIKKLDITQNPDLKYLNVRDTFLESKDPESISQLANVITTLAHHVVERHIYGGLFVFFGTGYLEGGRLSDASKAKLLELRNDYGWDIEPTDSSSW